MGYAHEYYHHLQHILSPDTDHDWQAQAFYEIGRSKSYYGRLSWDSMFVQKEQFASLFRNFAGRDYEPGTDDYFEACDILCYCFEEYEMDYLNGRDPINSLFRYLMDRYGERKTLDLMLYPDTVRIQWNPLPCRTGVEKSDGAGIGDKKRVQFRLLYGSRWIRRPAQFRRNGIGQGVEIAVFHIVSPQRLQGNQNLLPAIE